MSYSIEVKAAHKVQFFWIRTPESNRTLRSNGIGLSRGLGLLGPNQVGLSGGLGLLDKKKVGLFRGLGLLDPNRVGLSRGLGLLGPNPVGLWFGLGLGLLAWSGLGSGGRSPPARPPCYAPSRRGRMPLFLPVETHKLQDPPVTGGQCGIHGLYAPLIVGMSLVACRRRRLVGLEPQSRHYGTRA